MIARTAFVFSFVVLVAATSGSVRNGSAADAKLYEVTENMKLKTFRRADTRQQATSALTGAARAGTPLCPLPAGGASERVGALRWLQNAARHDAVARRGQSRVSAHRRYRPLTAARLNEADCHGCCHRDCKADYVLAAPISPF